LRAGWHRFVSWHLHRVVIVWTIFHFHSVSPVLVMERTRSPRTSGRVATAQVAAYRIETLQNGDACIRAPFL
jgi:hypothetical protein